MTHSKIWQEWEHSAIIWALATHTGAGNRLQAKHSWGTKHLSCTTPGSPVTEIAEGLCLEHPRAQWGECQTAATAGWTHILHLLHSSLQYNSLWFKSRYTSLFLNETPVADKLTNIIWTIKSERILRGGGGGHIVHMIKRNNKILAIKTWGKKPTWKI